MSIALGRDCTAAGTSAIAIGYAGHYNSAYESTFMTQVSPEWNSKGWRDWFAPVWVCYLGKVGQVVKIGALWLQTKKDETEIMISLNGKREFPLFETVDTMTKRLEDMENRLIALEYAPPGGGIYYQSALHDYTQTQERTSSDDLVVSPANEEIVREPVKNPAAVSTDPYNSSLWL